MKREVLTLALMLGAAGSYAATAATEVPVTDDFVTTNWSFGAPYVRGRVEPTRSSLGVSTPNPFTQDATGADAWEETTYFVFSNFASQGFTAPVQNATLRVRMVARPFGTLPSAATPFAVSAHGVTADPTLINPAAASGPGSFVEFKKNSIAGPLDTVSVQTSAAALYNWDVTSLVNEWIASGDASLKYAIAMTGRVGNPADTVDTGFFHAFDNAESTAAQYGARLLVTVPEPATLSALAGGLLVIRRRRNPCA